MFRTWLCLLKVFALLIERFLVKFVSLLGLVLAKWDVSTFQIWFFRSLSELFDVVCEAGASTWRTWIIFRFDDRTEGRLGLVGIWTGNIFCWSIVDHCVKTCWCRRSGQCSFLSLTHFAVALLGRIVLNFLHDNNLLLECEKIFLKILRVSMMHLECESNSQNLKWDCLWCLQREREST